MLLAASKIVPPTQTTQTFTANATWVAPATTSSITTLVGKGSDGTAAGAPYNDPSTSRSAVVATNRGLQYLHDDAPYTYNNTAGQWDWSFSQNEGPGKSATINAGGSGSVGTSYVEQYVNNYHYELDTITFTNAIAGSATFSTSAGWKTAGPVASGDFGTTTLAWSELGAAHAGTSATNGSNTTGFGFTFSGGVGGSAAPVTQSNVAVTPSSSYPLVIPAGGSITITYFQ